MTRIFATHKVLWSILFVLCISAILCGYLWMQGRYDALAMRRVALSNDVFVLRGIVVSRELENGELSSLDRISKSASGLGLGYEQVPFKVKAVEER